MDLPLQAADDLEAFVCLLDRLHGRLATAMSREEAAALLESSRGSCPGAAGPSGVEPDPLWEALEASGPGPVFQGLAAWVQRLLEALPPEHAERLVTEMAEDLDRAMEAAGRWSWTKGSGSG